MTDDTIRSMKEQMVPSDDVVSDLLTKIAALEASPENMDNVRSFDYSIGEKADKPKIEKPLKHAKKFTTKSIWFCGAAASILVLLSTLAMFGGLDSDEAQNAFNNIIDNPNVVVGNDDVKESPNGEEIDNSDVDDTDDNDSEKTDDKDDKKKGGFLSNLFGGDNDKASNEGDSQNSDNDSDKTSNKSDKNDNSVNDGDGSGNDSDNSGKSDGDSPNNGDKPNTGDKPNNGDKPNKGDTSIITPPPAPGGDDSPGNNYEVDDSKVTPGAPGESDISWQREILSESSVSNITISGSNYVVDSVASSPSVASSEVKSISLEIPATSTTNHTTVRARVKKVKNVSEDLMVALDANGFKETLLYTNKDYSPETLGQFISDAGLNTNTSFSKAVYCKGEKIGYSSYQRFNISNMSNPVSKYIFSNENAPLADYSSYKSGNTHVLFKSTSNPTCSVIDFGVSDNGYLYVKMASGKTFTFHIGESNANSFINHITGA